MQVKVTAEEADFCTAHEKSTCACCELETKRSRSSAKREETPHASPSRRVLGPYFVIAHKDIIGTSQGKLFKGKLNAVKRSLNSLQSRICMKYLQQTNKNHDFEPSANII